MKQATLAIALTLLGSSVWATEIKILKKPDEYGRGMDYFAKGDSCAMLWSAARRPGGKLAIMISRSACSLPLTEQQPYWGALLSKIIADHRKAKLTFFYWGKLEGSDPQDTLSARLMRAVAQSPKWDSQTGKLIAEPDRLANSLVQELVIQANIFAEFSQILAKFDLKPQEAEAEEIKVKKTLVDGKMAIVPYGGNVGLHLVPTK